jgi:cell shape-determining protein MreC
LKIAETQSALQPIVLFLRAVSRAQRRKLGGRLLIFGGSRPKRIPTLPSPCEEEATYARTRIHFLDDEPTIKPHESPRAVEIVIAFSRDSLLKGTLMAQRESALLTVTPGSLSGLAVIFLLLAAFFALLNGQKVKALRANATTPGAPVLAKVNAPTRGTTGAQQQDKTADTEDRAAKAEAALAQADKEKADLKGKLDASQQEIAALRQRAAGTQTNSNPSAPGAPAPADNAQSSDLQSQVDDLRHQLDGAEKEKALLAEKLQDAQQRPAQVKEAPKAETRRRRETASVQRESSSSHRAGVHGAVLAYNQAYNFVVLNLGARNGVEPNSEMLVLRDGTLIGKIRISSVEPATAIGDIMTNSLARGVQVQPGDSVIYAGTSP